MSSDVLHPVVRKLDDHPVPFDQEEIDQFWEEHDHLDADDAPHVDAAHEGYVETIVKRKPWHVFRTRFPFQVSGVVFWNVENGEAFLVDEDEGRWHEFVNLFAAIVDEEGDCREAEYSSGQTGGGSLKQRCENCGDSWVI